MSRRNPCGDLACDECRPVTMLENVFVWPDSAGLEDVFRKFAAALDKVARSVRLPDPPHRPRPLPIDGAEYRHRTRARRKR